MKFLTIIIVLIALYFDSFSQNTWEKLIYDANDDGVAIEEGDIDLKYDSLNDQYIFLANSHSSEGWLSVYKLSNSGDLLFRNYYSSEGGSGQNLKFTKDNGVIISDLEDNGGNAVKTLFKTDSSFNIIWKYQYVLTVGEPQGGLTETSDNKFLLSSAHRTPAPIPILIKTDSLGNVIGLKQFNPINGISKFIIQTIDGNYLLGINSYLNGQGLILCKTDTTENILWSKSYLRPNGYIHSAVEKPDGHLIIIGNTDTTLQTPIPAMFMMELDTAGNTIWCKTYGNGINNFIDYPNSDNVYAPMAVKLTSDGGYIITTFITTPSNQDINLVLLKTDSTGNIEWERRHGGSSSGENGINLIQTPDKGYFVVGYFYVSSNEIGYCVLKTDSLGFTSCGGLTDSIAQNSINPTDSSIIVTDSAIVINMSPANVHDTTDSAPNVDDGCLLDGITEISSDENGLLVYPNPTSGKFHLSYNGASKESEIYVYDVIGKEVYARRYIKDSMIDIDLSNEHKGIYFLNVTSEGERITVKVVVL